MSDSTTLDELREAVVALSVYNAVNLFGDGTVGSVVDSLRAQWSPRWAPVDEVVTHESVRAAAARCERCGVGLEVAGDELRVTSRNPKTRRGRDVSRQELLR